MWSGLFLVFILANQGNRVSSRRWRDDIPTLNLTLEKGKPLHLEQPYTKVQIEDLSGTLYSDAFSQLLQVVELRVTNNKITNIEQGAICAAPDLKQFEIDFTDNKNAPTFTKDMFENCGSLESLRIIGSNDNPLQIEDNFLQNSQNLKVLALSNVNLPDLKEGLLKNLESLINLELWKCNIERIDLKAFGALRNVEEITIIYNNLSAIPNGLFKSTPKLKKLFLRENEITGLTWDEFDGLSSLTGLQIGSNRIASLNPDNIAKSMPNLEEFGFELNPMECKQREAYANALRSKLNHSVNIEHKFDPGYYDSCEDYRDSMRPLQTLP